MATSSIKEIWELIEKFKDEVDLLISDDALILLVYLSRHEGIEKKELIEKLNKHLMTNPQVILDFLLKNKFIYVKTRCQSLHLTNKAKSIVKLIEYSKYDLTELCENSIPGYKLEEQIGRGSTGITRKAVKEKTNYDVVLKIFKPGILDIAQLENAIRSLKPLISDQSSLVFPRDYGSFVWRGLSLNYIEMDYVKGTPLGEFLNLKINIDLQETLINYIKEVGEALRTIEEGGFTHSDLHENNILMVVDNNYLEGNVFRFRIVDFIGINSIDELKKYELNDMEYFKRNFFKIIERYAYTPSGEIDQKKLGPRLSYIYENLLNYKYKNFKEIRDSLSEKLPEKGKIIFEKPFNYLIFETYDVNNPLWLKRFELESSIYHLFTDFRPLICSGPRGCGKTIYLRSLSFIPKIIKISDSNTNLKNKIVYFNKIFGIYFACRQGEFKVFSNRLYEFTLKTQLFLKHIIILKIIRRTISLIEEAYSETVFESEPKIDLILEFLHPYLFSKLAITSTSNDKHFKELSSILINEENNSLDNIGKEDTYSRISNLFDEKILIKFFEAVRNAIPELSDFKFYIIFDDLSEPQVYPEMQMILNCLIACHNGLYCCKFSTDKYAYTFQDMFGKALQMPHDYTYLDFSILAEPGREHEYSSYLERIINRQLEISDYQKKIQQYLEPNKMSNKEIILLLSRGDHLKVKFAGWDLIVRFSSSSIRDALVMCEEIWEQFGGEDKHKDLKEGKEIISTKIQDKALRKYSEEVYAALINIEFSGKEIFNIVRNFGEISRQYLRRSITIDPNRQYELIAIERRDNKKISEEASDLLRKLIRHSVFLDRGFSFSREQIGLVSKFVLHKKYTPALKITFREREHLRLDSKQLEEFLLNPDQFTEKELRKIDNEIMREKYQTKLSDFKKMM
jgi:serine/threonine protein kinase